jgi:hypothetical protein
MDEINEVLNWWDEPEPEPVEEYNRRGGYMPKDLPPNDGNAFMTEGLCAGWAYEYPSEANLWFSKPGTKEDCKATDICWDCPVRRECLKWATDVGEHGTWGGQPERIRRKHDNNFLVLIDLPNPYNTTNKHTVYYRENLRDHVEKD